MDAVNAKGTAEIPGNTFKNEGFCLLCDVALCVPSAEATAQQQLHSMHRLSSAYYERAA
jgi:ssRNA-specific RNase YbeY (16S rRNA maturation enzyme)